MKFTDIRKHLSRFKVGIAGAGGLGSNCAAALVRSGVGTIVLADFDVVEPINLNRQFYFSDQIGMKKTEALKINLLRIYPEVTVIEHCTELDKNNIPVIFSGCDVIVEAFDRADMKEMIIETVLTRMPGTALIVGSGMAGWGNSETLRYRKIDEFLYVCGDESTPVSDDLPPLAPRVGIVSNMQANTVLEILMMKQAAEKKL
jgi:sulfur carrier protein ThiS adenylyltransferase